MTRKFSGILTILVLATSAMLSAQTAPAPAATGSQKVGIIDIQSAIMATNEGRRDFEALQKKFEPKSTELQGLGKEIDTLKTQLNTQGDKMNEDARSKLVRDIDTKQKNLQRQGEDAQNDYSAQQNEIAKRILQKLSPIIVKYAQDNGFGLLIDASQPWPQGPVLWASQTVDVTKAIVDQYNAASGIPAPAPAAAAPAKPATTAPAGAAKPPAKPGN